MNKILDRDKLLMSKISAKSKPKLKEIKLILDDICELVKSDSRGTMSSPAMDLFIKWRTLMFHFYEEIYEGNIIRNLEEGSEIFSKKVNPAIQNYRENVLSRIGSELNGSIIIAVEKSDSLKEIYEILKSFTLREAEEGNIEPSNIHLTILSEIVLDFKSVSPFFDDFEKSFRKINVSKGKRINEKAVQLRDWILNKVPQNIPHIKSQS